MNADSAFGPQIKDMLRLLLVLSALVVVALTAVRRHLYLRRWDRFPGFKGWQALPVVGHAYMLGGEPIYKLLDLQRKFGDIFRLDLGPTPMIILTGFKECCQVYKSEVWIFKDKCRCQKKTCSFHKLYWSYWCMYMYIFEPFYRILQIDFSSLAYCPHANQTSMIHQAPVALDLVKEQYGRTTESCLPRHSVLWAWVTKARWKQSSKKKFQIFALFWETKFRVHHHKEYW